MFADLSQVTSDNHGTYNTHSFGIYSRFMNAWQDHRKFWYNDVEMSIGKVSSENVLLFDLVL